MKYLICTYECITYIHIATSKQGSNRSKTLPTPDIQEEMHVCTEHHSALSEGSTSAGK